MNWQDYKVDVPEGRSGDWCVERYEVTLEDQRYQEFRCALNPQRPRRVVPAGTYTRLTRGCEIVMSDTPDEIRDHYGPICMARGQCLVGGLGLGVVVKAMLDKPEVTKVTVLELSPDVITLVGPYLHKRYGGPSGNRSGRRHYMEAAKGPAVRRGLDGYLESHLRGQSVGNGDVESSVRAQVFMAWLLVAGRVQSTT